MSRLFAYLARFIVILVGFFCASLGASAFLHFLAFGALSLTGEEIAFVSGGMVVTVPFLALFIGYLAFLPGFIAILAAEVLARRDWLYFAITGAMTGLAVAWTNGFGHVGELDTTTIAVGFAATGIVGGLCYWLVAGRSSGAGITSAIERTRTGS